MCALCNPNVCEKFIITFDDSDSEYDDNDSKYHDSDDSKYDDSDSEEIAKWKEIEKQTWEYYDLTKFENYVRWYVHENQGTIEQPYTLHGENGEVLTAKSFYNTKANTMVEMKLLFDESQLPKVKEFLTLPNLQKHFFFKNVDSLGDRASSGGRRYVNKHFPIKEKRGDFSTHLQRTLAESFMRNGLQM
jgi:hypothetical protein